MSFDEAYEDKTMAVVCYALYLLAFATGITAIIGVIIAYTQRPTAGPVMESHYTFLIRTFWIGLVLMIGGGVVCGSGRPAHRHPDRLPDHGRGLADPAGRQHLVRHPLRSWAWSSPPRRGLSAPVRRPGLPR
jgi:hypothetical protein